MASWLKRESWEKPFILRNTRGKPDGNCVLFFHKDVIFLFYVTIYNSWWTESKLKLTVSRDYGKTWSKPKVLTNELGIMVRNKPLVLKNGTILLPAYDEKSMSSLVFASDDDGESWRIYSKIKVLNAIQPALVELEDGKILAMMRNTKKGHAIIALSYDNGRTFAKIKFAKVKNPNSSLDLIKLRDNKLLLAFNNHEELRTPLSLAVSEDGENWKILKNLEEGVGEFSYPCLIQSKDGLIHVTYTSREGECELEKKYGFKYHAYNSKIKYARFNEEWLYS